MTKPSFIHRTSCRLCESPQVELAVPIKASPIADVYLPAHRANETQELYPLDLYLCRTCGHVQLLDVVNPEILFGDYIYHTSASASLVEHFHRYADELHDRFLKSSSGLAVDIGSNDGTLLRFLKEKGAKVLGIDPATSIAEEATRSGVETLPIFFNSELARKLKKERGAATCITANNVFAHSDSLPDMADGIRELLAPDGVFTFEVSYLVDIIEKLLFDTVYHEHLCYHSIKPLRSFFAHHGLDLFDVTRLSNKGGSIRGYVQLAGGGSRPKAPIIDKLLALEEKMGLDSPNLFKDYTAKITGIKADLRGLLKELKNSGKTIAGYGASATATTLIYNFELGPYLSYLADDNPTRHGVVSPGLHLLVVPSKALYEKKPDYVVILAWQYAEPILKRNHAYREQGGHFILPLPQVKIL